MTGYIVRRLLLLPLTLFAIILVNFIILNLAPGDPSNMPEKTDTGDAARSADMSGIIGENTYLQFREHYGLTLPVLLNSWPQIKKPQVKAALEQLNSGKKSRSDEEKMSLQDYFKLRTLWGDRARFIMPILLHEAFDKNNSPEIRRIAANLFIRGGTRQGYVGPTITGEQKKENRQIADSNLFLSTQRVSENDTLDEIDAKVGELASWFQKYGDASFHSKKDWGKAKIFLFETRFFKYLSRVLTLDFGTLRNDSNKTVISEVAKRIKYSLTLALIPMLITFVLCQIFGMTMAVKHNKWPDVSLNIFFLILFAIPIFVVAPFLIEKVALHRTVPFTNISIPYSGFHSPHEIYEQLTSPSRLADIALHLVLPLIAIMYGTLAMQARLSRTAFLEVLNQDYIRTAKAKGLFFKTILIKHVGRNGAITIVTSLAASLGVILGGSLIVETVFEINGFGRFFYEAILNRDYNVVLFSAFAGSFLTLIGYLIADISYGILDPRIHFN